jgi:hypothetical protein
MTMPEDTSNLDDFIATMNGGDAPVETVTPTPEPAPEEEAPVEESGTPEDAPEADETAEKTEEQPKKGRSTADRIKKLTYEREQFRRELEALKAAQKPAEAAPLTEKPEKGNDTASEAPNPENYRYGELDPQFMRDTAKFEAKVELAAFREELAKQNEAAQQAQAAQREVAALQEKANAIQTVGRAKFDDFDEVVLSGALAGISKEAAQVIADSDVAAEAFYHLASNPEEAADLFRQPLAKQALWLARFEVKTAAPPPRKVTQAPEPMQSVRGSGSRATVPDDTDDLDAFSRKFFKRA